MSMGLTRIHSVINGMVLNSFVDVNKKNPCGTNPINKGKLFCVGKSQKCCFSLLRIALAEKS